MINKKGISVIKYVYMILLTSILFILFVIVFFNLNSITLNEKSLQHQIIVDSIIKNCYSLHPIENISKSTFLQEDFSQCIPENKEITGRIIIDTLNEDNLKNTTLRKKIEFGDNNFQREQQFCSILSTKHCSKITHKILISHENELKEGLMTIEIIS